MTKSPSRLREENYWQDTSGVLLILYTPHLKRESDASANLSITTDVITDTTITSLVN